MTLDVGPIDNRFARVYCSFVYPKLRMKFKDNYSAHKLDEAGFSWKNLIWALAENPWKPVKIEIFGEYSMILFNHMEQQKSDIDRMVVTCFPENSQTFCPYVFAQNLKSNFQLTAVINIRVLLNHRGGASVLNSATYICTLVGVVVSKKYLI